MKGVLLGNTICGSKQRWKVYCWATQYVALSTISRNEITVDYDASHDVKHATSRFMTCVMEFYNNTETSNGTV